MSGGGKNTKLSSFLKATLTLTQIAVSQGFGGMRVGSRSDRRVGIYRLEKLRALSTPLKSSGRPVLSGHTFSTVYSLFQRVPRTYSY